MSPFTVLPAVPLRDIISRPSHRFSPGLTLVSYFPPSQGLNGAATTIADASRLFRAGMAFPSKYQAVSAIVGRNMEQNEARGHGNAAVRRAFRLPQPVPFRASA
jgi:hypothetical protein